MIDELKPYPEYRDSGFPWLGQVPSHWTLRRMKSVVYLNPRKSESAEQYRVDAPATFLPMERVGTDGRIDASIIRPASQLWNGFTYFRKGDVLVAKITPCFENGKGACLDNLPTQIGFGSTEFHVLRPGKDLTSRFLFLLSRIHTFRDMGAQSMTGSAGQQRVPESFIADYPAIIPPPDEQAAIVRFLDRANGKIERAIRAKKKLIALLNEQKQAIIHRAVTRGLDPNVKRKPSGIPWLGDVPEHWTVKKIKFLVSTIGGMTPNKGVARFWNGTIPWVSPKDMKVREIADSQDHISETALQQTNISLINPPSVLIVVRGMILAHTFPSAVTKVPVTINQDMKALVPRSEMKATYMVSLLTGLQRDILSFVGESGHGTRCLRTDEWANFSLPVPPLSEQLAINERLESNLCGINSSITHSEREIALLREYRTTLTADIVTGKLDVREAVKQLPAAAEELPPTGDLPDDIEDEPPEEPNT